MELPDITAYKDVNSNSLLQPFPFERIHNYLQPLGKPFGEKLRDLYDGHFLKFVRFNTSNGTSFLRTVCKAEMKKGPTYIVDISIDKYGCVLQCQCECGAGMGPEAHCKHVCALLYVVYQFYLGKPLKTEETCTH